MFGLSINQNASLPDIGDMRALITILTLGNDMRGGDAWGYVVPNEDPTPVKGLGDLEDYEDLYKLAELPYVMVHTRKGTLGGNTVENAHPFTVDHIIGAHNGMIFNYHELDNKYPEYRPFRVDSNYLVAHIAKERNLDELTGYGTVEFINKNIPGSVFIGKLTESGELAVASIPDFGTIWSSSKATLEQALKFARMKHSFWGIKAGRVYEVKNGILYATKMSCEINSKTRDERKKENANNYYGAYAGGGGNSFVASHGWHYCREPHCTTQLQDGKGNLCSEHKEKANSGPLTFIDTGHGLKRIKGDDQWLKFNQYFYDNERSHAQLSRVVDRALYLQNEIYGIEQSENEVTFSEVSKMEIENGIAVG